MTALLDLNPEWVGYGEGRHGMGIYFDCPHCFELGGEDRQYARRLLIWFANPVDGGPPATPSQLPAPRWKRKGETFDVLTLSPSINDSHSGHWHGFIRAGKIE